MTIPDESVAVPEPVAAPNIPVSEIAPDPAPPVKRRRRVGVIITIVLLSLALAAAVTFLVLYMLQLQEAHDRIREQNQQIKEQEELIELKETFGAAMNQLLDDASEFEGVLVGDLVPVSNYEVTASRAWAHRWTAEDLRRDTLTVEDYIAELAELKAAAAGLAGSNVTGSQYEATIDLLGHGYVDSLLYAADSYCESDALACVSWEDPLTVHFDSVDNEHQSMTDFIRMGIAYHEFAHVLQMTNPDPTEEALDAFDGDSETMADCFALTYLDGWKLDHRVWVSSYMYWDVNIGYGYTCDDSQRQVIIDWYSKLGYRAAPISQ